MLLVRSLYVRLSVPSALPSLSLCVPSVFPLHRPSILSGVLSCVPMPSLRRSLVRFPNLVLLAFSLAPAPPPSKGKGHGNEVAVSPFFLVAIRALSLAFPRSSLTLILALTVTLVIVRIALTFRKQVLVRSSPVSERFAVESVFVSRAS